MKVRNTFLTLIIMVIILIYNNCNAEEEIINYIGDKPLNVETIGQITADGFIYRLETAQMKGLCKEGEICLTARLTISDSETGELIHDEITGLEMSPGKCGDFPIISAWPYKSTLDDQTHLLVITCGADGWYESKITAYMRDPALRQIRSARLNFHNMEPNLTLTKDKRSYVARNKSGYGYFFPKLFIKITSTESQLLFKLDALDSDVADACRTYFNDYMHLIIKNYNEEKSYRSKKWMDGGSLYEIMSYLLVTQDQSFFCSKLDFFHEYNVTDSKINEYIKEISRHDIPKLSTKACKRGAK